jgi:hypothetical protein
VFVLTSAKGAVLLWDSMLLSQCAAVHWSATQATMSLKNEPKMSLQDQEMQATVALSSLSEPSGSAACNAFEQACCTTQLW